MYMSVCGVCARVCVTNAENGMGSKTIFYYIATPQLILSFKNCTLSDRKSG